MSSRAGGSPVKAVGAWWARQGSHAGQGDSVSHGPRPWGRPPLHQLCASPFTRVCCGTPMALGHLLVSVSGGGSRPVRSAALSWVRLAQPLPRAPSLMPGLQAANAFRISFLLSQGDGPGFCAHPLLRDFSLSPQPPPPCPVVGILRLFPSSQH